MEKRICLVLVTLAMWAPFALGQDDGEQRMKKALVGRFVQVKIDLPAINTGVDLVLDNKEVSYNEADCNKLLKDYGVGVKKDSRARITDLRVSGKGIELDIDGGGLPGRDWVVGNLKLEEPAPLVKSEREVELERQTQSEQNPSVATYLRNELESERQWRYAQDERNREAFKRFEGLRSQYIKENRKNWGSKVTVVVRPTKETLTMRDMVRSLAKYVELIPIEKPAK